MLGGQDWAALDSMFNSADSAPPQASYGKDGPVKVTGMTPGMIGPPKATKAKKATPKPKADPNEIWSTAEVDEENDPLDIDDGRKQPEYDIDRKSVV